MGADELTRLVLESRQDEKSRSRIMELIAREVYARPGRYGFSSADEVGEAFSTYWNRILGLVERYEDRGVGFMAYVTSSFRYFAISSRRRKAMDYYRESACLVEENAEEASPALDRYAPVRDAATQPRHAARLELLLHGDRAGLPSRRAGDRSSRALKQRISYLCVKCAPLMDDDAIYRVARLIDLDGERLVLAARRVRHSCLEAARGRESKRRGRDAAWLRMSANELRLLNAHDPDTINRIRERIERDRSLYSKAVASLARSRTLASNELVARTLGVPKGTVDAGLHRLMKRAVPLYARPEARYNARRRTRHDSVRRQQQRAQDSGNAALTRIC